MTQENILKKRYDFVLLFDVKDGNPNGDPDAGNLPRLDAETGNGLVTDVCLKRKVRNFVQLAKQGEAGYDIFVKEKAILNNAIDEAHDSEVVKAQKKDADKTDAARQFMCAKYFDIRTFGAVMSTGKNAGQVRGPVQMTFGRSIDPIVSSEHSITRMAVATEAEAEKQKGDNRTMGRKFTVPYGLYVSHGFISAHLAAQTGFTTDDLNVFWEALEKMFWEDHSAARGEMNVRGLYVFEHDSALGRAPAHELFEKIKVERKDSSIPARSFNNYNVTIDENMPEGVKLIRKVG
ncbi:type I-C CRISPR-associated protein Cas7/Csd2 [Fibrobacter sp.]|uniref:type I-C CRISPR-associated protein Cas7/Csd2 n=1 Tax=Fibrobacter sp. TaxID=35828 RepID=UPI0025BF3B5C|nr:type I-C CRISPR-associated protein Cas7/Csd2 [Fibrobacter sp.]MCI6436569.1 type I-C CRISPR-associated protein Cas7/Csd2 [Fibrobacter sp.]MDD7499035.1 type I-C CRISPR-associated protein Cas7/Csd2 [Fibrobacter sp.]MDY5724382.1 type I-C CRISPR-associated protein Cas7/Csd2 [Fibrobacter sp.]